MVGPQRHAMNGNAQDTKIPLCTKLFTETMASPMRTSQNEDNNIEVGYYLHKKTLGEGGFGKVRLATHIKTNQKVAIKMMNKEKLGQDLQRVRIEIDTLKILQHENIAKLLQVIETNSDIYLVLEYCSGGELFDYLISKKRLTEGEVKVILEDLFNVLLYIHDRGFAHRDLKPENILFDEKHKIKLIDFGLAANSSQNKSGLSFLSTCCGSPAYAAPELLRGMTYSGPAVDVWSAGVLLYSLLVGQLPFDDDNINNLYKKIQNGRFFMPQWLSSDVRGLISSMLKTNPSERISVKQVLEHKWLKRTSSTLKPTIKPNNLNESVIMEEFDEEAFKCCRSLFPELSEGQLRVNITKFGYHTATYLLLRNNSEAKNRISQISKTNSLQNKTNSSNRPNLDSPRIVTIKRKLMLDTENHATPVKRTKDNVIQTPIQTKTPTNPKNPTKLPVLNDRNRLIQLVHNRNTPNVVQSPRTPVWMGDKLARRIISPKMKTNENNCPSNPVNSNKVDKVNSNDTTDKLATIKSPLREINNHVKSTPTKTPHTPINVAKRQLKASTSKKSLLKRLIGSATPAKSNSPRKLDISTHSNNITMTSFQNPQECIDRLVHTLTSKGVDCVQKEYETFNLKRPISSKPTFLVRKNPKM